MALANQPIRRKLMSVMMLATMSVVLLTTAAFMIYDYLTFRKSLVFTASSTASILANNVSAAVAFRSESDAQEVLGALRTNPRMLAAAVYDSAGRRFASYPSDAPSGTFPPQPGDRGYRFGLKHLDFFEPIVAGDGRLGTLFLRADGQPLLDRLKLYALIASLILIGAALASWFLSQSLQRSIADPIIALAKATQTVSQKGDYSIRAAKMSEDEVGLLTESFNQMLARIQEAEQVRSFLAAIVDSSDSAIIGKDLQGRVVSWNPAAERIFGYTAAEMLGQPIDRLLPPSELEREAQLIEEVKHGKTHLEETVRKRKDGTVIDIALALSPIKSARGEIIGISSIARDIVDRKRWEQELQESRARFSGIIESAMDAIISIDRQQRITIFNRAAERMFGYSAEKVLGKPLTLLLPARFREIHEKHVDEFGRTGVTSRAMGSLQPLSGLRSNGEEFPIEASISQIEIGGSTTYTVILRDITERRQAEEQIKRFNSELEKRVRERTAELISANKELESFTYSVAHDLRAPLRHIGAFSQIVLEDFAGQLPEEARQHLQTIARASGNMSRLVDDLLNLARVGRQELDLQPTPLQNIVKSVITDLNGEAGGRVIDWEVKPLPIAMCDPGLMKQVFTNLLSNAVKYTRPKPRARIEIGAEQQDGEAIIYVRDNGVGFNMEYSSKLFGVFQRLHRAEEFEGTGVGLAIVDRIIRKHRGRIWAESELGQGASFYFSLPIEKN